MYYHPGDFIYAKIISIINSTYYLLSTIGDIYGVIAAKSPMGQKAILPFILKNNFGIFI